MVSIPRPITVARPRLGRRLFALVLSGLSTPAMAQVVGGGLNTRVNGTDGGSCQAGACRVEGGIGAGPNAFYRFRQFDTRQGVSGVTIDNRGRANVVVGVTHPQGTFLNKPLALSEAANLFWLSPGGIWLGRGASFSPVNTLMLSTATSLNLGEGKGFDVLRTTAEQAAGLNGVPDLKQPATVSLGTLQELGLEANGPVVLEGGRIQVERSLLIQAPETEVRAVAGAGNRLQAGAEVSLQAQRMDLNDLQLGAGGPGQRGLVTLQTFAPADQPAGAIHLGSSSLQGRMVQVFGGSVDLVNTTIEAPKGLIRLESTAAHGTISLKASRLDLEVHSLADLLAPASQEILAPAVLTQTPLIHLRSKGDLSLSEGSEIVASQNLAPLREAVASRGEPWPEPKTISLADTSGNVLLESDRAIRIANAKVRADASANLAGNIGLVARGSAATDGIHIDTSTLSAQGGAGSGDIRIASAGGINLRNSQLLVESGHAPSLDGTTIDFTNLSPFAGGEITLLNTAVNRPISLDNSRLEALTHTGQGPLFGLLYLPPGDRDPLPFFDLHDDGDSVSTLFDNDFKPIGQFPQGRLTLVSDGGIQVRNKALLDAGSHAPDSPNKLEAFGGQLSLVNRSSSAPLLVEASTLVNRSDPATSPTYLNPFDASATLPVGRPGQMELWSAAELIIRGSQVDGGQGGSMQLTSRTPAVLQGSVVVQGTQAQLEGISQRSGPGPLGDPQGTDRPTGPITAQDPVLARLTTESRDVGVVPKTVVVVIDDRTQIVTVTPSGNVTTQTDPTQEQLVAVLGQERAAALPPRPLAPATVASVERRLAPDQPPASLVALAQAGAGSPLGTSESLSGPRQQATRSERNTAAAPSPRPADLDGAAASRAFNQSEQRGQRDTLAGLGLTATASAEQPTTLWLQQRLESESLRLARQLAKPYRPAIVRLSLTPGSNGTAALDLLYLPPQGDMKGWRVDVPEERLKALIARFQQQLSRMEEPDLEKAGSAASQLSGLLLQPLLPTLQKDGISALLLSVDRGLQAVPYAALPVAPGVLLGDAYALTLTPSLGLTGLASSAEPATGKMLLGGSSRFANGLAELPLVRQELQTLAAENSSDLLLDSAFSDRSLLRAAGTNLYRRVHLATHAEFRGGRPTVARLYTASGDLNLSELAKTLREGPSRGRLDLLSLSACRTALGDEQSELGLVGLALRTGSRSALGTLWFVDDAASAAFFVEFYRQLARGLPKDEALRQTRLAFRRGTIRLDGDRLVGADAKPLVAGLSPGDRQRLATGLAHPYFWAGMTLSGSPW